MRLKRPLIDNRLPQAGERGWEIERRWLDWEATSLLTRDPPSFIFQPFLHLWPHFLPRPITFPLPSSTCCIPSSHFLLISLLYSFVCPISLTATSSFVSHLYIQYHILKSSFLSEELSESLSYNFIRYSLVQRPLSLPFFCLSTHTMYVLSSLNKRPPT